MEIEKLGIMIDCSRNAVININTFSKFVKYISKMGYNRISLYMEDTYEVDNEPYFGYMRGGYSQDEIRLMDKIALQYGVEFIPCIQVLGHLEMLFRYENYRKINDIDDTLIVGDNRVYELIDNMFSSLSKCVTTRNINIGMDETYRLGRGEYFNRNGYVKIENIMNQHLTRVLKIADKYGFKCEMWGDMFMTASYGDMFNFTKDNSDIVREKIPENLTLVNWDYHHTDKEHYVNCLNHYLKLTSNVAFAGGAWCWRGFNPDNYFSIKAMKASLSACEEKGIKNIFFTLWGDGGGECSPFSLLPSLYYASEYVKGNRDETLIKNNFYKMFNMDFDEFCKLDLPDKICSETGLELFNTAKVMLFSDLFMGVFDEHVIGKNAKKYYIELAKDLDKYKGNSEFGYIFSCISALCNVLAIKFDLGARTRELYGENNKKVLKDLAMNEYTELINKVKEFYNSFKKLWNVENKPYGFEIQDARFGGLIMRIKHCRERLIDYADNKTDNIIELEEKLLIPFGREKFDGIYDIKYFDTYNRIISPAHL